MINRTDCGGFYDDRCVVPQNTLNALRNCRRNHNELPETFALYFRGLAVDHLIKAGRSLPSIFDEVSTNTLMINPTISKETVTNSELQIIFLGTVGKENITILTSEKTSSKKIFSNTKGNCRG